MNQTEKDQLGFTTLIHILRVTEKQEILKGTVPIL